MSPSSNQHAHIHRLCFPSSTPSRTPRLPHACRAMYVCSRHSDQTRMKYPSRRSRPMRSRASPSLLFLTWAVLPWSEYSMKCESISFGHLRHHNGRDDGYKSSNHRRDYQGDIYPGVIYGMQDTLHTRLVGILSCWRCADCCLSGLGGIH